MARMHQQLGDHEKAREVYRSLIYEVNDPIGVSSILDLAESELNNNDDPIACIEYCRKLWRDDLSEPLKKQLLSLMGMAYQKSGDANSAIFCFYGALPATASSPQKEDQ